MSQVQVKTPLNDWGKSQSKLLQDQAKSDKTFNRSKKVWSKHPQDQHSASPNPRDQDNRKKPKPEYYNSDSMLESLVHSYKDEGLVM